MQRSATGTAHPRAGLLGNPSDVYQGKAIAFSFAEYAARVDIEAADRFVLRPGPSDGMAFDSLREATERFASAGPEDGLRLLRAAIHRFETHCGVAASLEPDDPRLRFELGYATDIPRQVGLAGSSAIIVATLRALAQWFEVEIEPAMLAELALSAEREDLGIAAGPMDRVIQSYGGMIGMDFEEPRSAASYTRLDPALLPPLYIAFDPAGGERSGKAHGELRARLEAGDREAIEIIQTFPRIVDEGVGCLERGDFDRFRELVDLNFATRDRIFWIGPRDREMVAIGRESGAACKLCGSGGAIVGVPVSESDLAKLERRYREAGFAWLRPTVGPAHAEARGEGT